MSVFVTLVVLLSFCKVDEYAVYYYTSLYCLVMYVIEF